MNDYYKKYPVTFTLILMIVIVYGYTSLKYGIDMNAYQGMEVGGFNPVLVIAWKQYYRLITANFIHFGLMHIFCNAYSLYNLGTLMESILGLKKYLIVIFASMITTTLFPFSLYFINGTDATSIMGGISGVIFGLVGCLLALAYLYRNVYMYLFKQIASSLILMLFLSFAVPSIFLTGHIGGMIGGFSVTFLIEKVGRTKNKIIN